MILGLFNELNFSINENSFIQKFTKELLDYFNNGRKNINMDNEELNENVKEDTLYQVVDKTENGVYLQNTENDVIFEETNLSSELYDMVESDFILRYKDGEYIFEKELTDEFFDSFVGIAEFKQIQDEFINETNILELDENTIYTVLEHEKDYSILGYNENDSFKVPSALLPFFINENSILKFEEGKFIKV